MTSSSAHGKARYQRIGLVAAALVAGCFGPLNAAPEPERKNETLLIPEERKGEQRREAPRAEQAPEGRPAAEAEAPRVDRNANPRQAPAGRPSAAQAGARPAAVRPAPRPSNFNPAPRPAGPAAGFNGQGGRPAAQPMRPMPGPKVEVVRTRNGGEIQRGPGGAIRQVRTPSGAVIHYAPNGMRRVEMVRPDGRVLFTNGTGRGGYVQRPFMLHGQPFVQRTYVMGGVVSIGLYRPYVRAGITFNLYTPTRFYQPGFYAWSYQPWGRPVAYRWGWASDPWYGYYRGYYTPYPYYNSPLFWLTDFVCAATFEAAYQNSLDAGAPPAPATDYPAGGLTPDVKQAIADEVRLEVQQERADQQAASQGYPPPAPPALFSDNVSRIFLVQTSTQAYAGSQEVWLAEGDVLQLNGPPPPDATYADVVVLASRNRNTPKGSVVSVSLQDLQEMQNRMRGNIDRGLGDLQANQGQGGLPPVPPANLGATDAPYAQGLAPEPGAANELNQVASEANASGQTVLSQANQAPPPPQSGRSVTLGMSEQEVHDILGTPKQTADLGNKRIEVYQDFKVTFVGGVVSDIQ